MPDGVTRSSDVTAPGQDVGSVMCWWTEVGTVTINEVENKAYNVTIGANGGVVAHCSYRCML